MKYLLYIAIVISIIIAIYEGFFWDTELSAILELIAWVLVIYGYILLKCCYTTTKKKR